MLILAIESSCDETAFAVVEDGRRVHSNAIASQIDLHARFGGVVPEIASRAHLEACIPMYKAALQEAGTRIEEIDAIAVTRGPGLAGCLLVGVEFAKGLALRHAKPLLSVHHIAGHLYSPFIGEEQDAWGTSVSGPEQPFAPYVALVISGGHSSLVHVRDWLEFDVLGETLDDAVGEAYDKVAKLLGLGYPGGPLLDRLALTHPRPGFTLPRPLLNRDDLMFSFSGLKTAVARLVETEFPNHPPDAALPESFVNEVAGAFQQAAIDVLLTKAERALEKTGLSRLALTGGVACNRGLRQAVKQRLPHIHVAVPEPQYCTDNAAMIGGAAYRVAESAQLSLNAAPGLALTPAPAWCEE